MRTADAAVLRSQTSTQPCTLTFFNKTAHNVKVYWNNYDADKEFFALLPPKGEYTIDSFAVSDCPRVRPTAHRQGSSKYKSFLACCSRIRGAWWMRSRVM